MCLQAPLIQNLTQFQGDKPVLKAMLFFLISFLRMLTNHSNSQVSPPGGNDDLIIFELTGKLGSGFRCQKEI